VSHSAEILIQPYVALVGSPNSGKTSLFNALTGGRQKVGNYPGVTVERKEGHVRTASGHILKILDLPGTYSLDANTLDEAVTRDILLANHLEENQPDLLVAVADATNLERSLGLVLELKLLGLPVLLALNMMDLARHRGFQIDFEKLSCELGMSVFPVVAVKKEGIDVLLKEIEKYLLSHPKNQNASASHIEKFPDEQILFTEFPKPSKEEVRNRFKKIDRILKVAKIHDLKPAIWTDRIDRIILHPWWGTLLLVMVLTAVFQAIFNWAHYPMDWIGSSIGIFSNYLKTLLPEGVLQSFLINGVIAGVGSVIVFLPQIMLLFFFIMLLEDSGYMARAAFLMDRHMSRVGLHGRAFIPLLSSFACAIPGIMATRTIENKKDRIITILISPLMACSARIPVYTLLISAFIPNHVVWGPLRLQGLVMMGLYFLGVVVALIVAFVLKVIMFRGPKPIFLMELPTYKWPNFRNVMIGMWERARLFLRRAGTVILMASMAIWLLSSYPKAPPDLAPGQSAITYSFAGHMGKFMEPVIKPIGFDWSIGIGLVTGIIAREVIIGSLATVYSIENQGKDVTSRDLGRIIKERWGLATGLSLLVFFVFAMQCLSTLAIVRRETNSWKWPLFMFIYMTVLAYGASYITYHLTLYLTA
jgi:ferrous iron transport protein B